MIITRDLKIQCFSLCSNKTISSEPWSWSWPQLAYWWLSEEGSKLCSLNKRVCYEVLQNILDVVFFWCGSQKFPAFTYKLGWQCWPHEDTYFCLSTLSTIMVIFYKVGENILVLMTSCFTLPGFNRCIDVGNQHTLPLCEPKSLLKTVSHSH